MAKVAQIDIVAALIRVFQEHILQELLFLLSDAFGATLAGLVLVAAAWW